MGGYTMKPVVFTLGGKSFPLIADKPVYCKCYALFSSPDTLNELFFSKSGSKKIEIVM